MNSNTQELSIHAASRMAIPVASRGATYAIAIKVRTGYGNISIRNDSEHSQLIRENGGKSVDTLPLFEAYVHGQDAAQDELSGAESAPKASKRRSRKEMISITNSGTVLSTLLDKLQKHMICSGSERWWFFAEMKLGDIQAGLRGAEQERLLLLQELSDRHDDAYALYKKRLTNVLGKAGRLKELPIYLAKFPTLEQIRESFRIEVEGPMRVPSAMELAKETNPEFKNWMTQLHQQIARDVPRVIEQLFEAISDFLGRVETTEAGSLTNIQAAMLTKSYDRVTSLKALYESMATDSSHPIESILNQVLAIAQDFTSKRFTKDQIGEKLLNLKSAVLAIEQIAEPTTKGAKALARWAGVITLGDRLKDLKAEVLAFNEAAPDMSDEERLAGQQRLQIKIESASGLLGAIASDLLGLIEIDSLEDEPEELEETISEAPINTWVEEAGF